MNATRRAEFFGGSLHAMGVEQMSMSKELRTLADIAGKVDEPQLEYELLEATIAQAKAAHALNRAYRVSVGLPAEDDTERIEAIHT